MKATHFAIFTIKLKQARKKEKLNRFRIVGTWDQTWMRMRRSELWRFSNRRSEKPRRASSICWSSSGVPSSGWNSQTWRPKWPFKVLSHVSLPVLPPLSSSLLRSSLTVSAPVLSFHIPQLLWICFSFSVDRMRELWEREKGEVDNGDCSVDTRQDSLFWLFPRFLQQLHARRYKKMLWQILNSKGKKSFKL